MKYLVLLMMLSSLVSARPVSIQRGTVELKADVTEFPSGLVHLSNPYVVKDNVNHAISLEVTNPNYKGYLAYVQKLCVLYGLPYGVNLGARVTKGQSVPVMHFSEEGGVSFSRLNEFNLLTELNCNKRVPVRR